MSKVVKRQASQGVGSLISIQSIKTSKTLQPRRYFASDKMEQLTASVKEHGILEPLIVRPLDGETYELVAGERRLRAAQDLGLNEVPVIIRQFSDQQALEVALLENLQRDDLNPIDETDGILKLLCQSLGEGFENSEDVTSLLNKAANAKRRNTNLTETEIYHIEKIDRLFSQIGRLNRESFRTNRLPLLRLPQDVLSILKEGKLEYTKAKAIAKLDSLEQRAELMKWAISDGLSLSEVKKEIKRKQTEKIDREGKKVLADSIPINLDELPQNENNRLRIGEQQTPEILEEIDSSIENLGNDYTSATSEHKTLLSPVHPKNDSPQKKTISQTEQNFKKTLSNLSVTESEAWSDPSKQEILQRILSELESLLLSS
jgi:ParB family transcriptional regulator, chromosome partitioning protein